MEFKVIGVNGFRLVGKSKAVFDAIKIFATTQSFQYPKVWWLRWAEDRKN